jgi:hypothetical protein
MIKQKISEYCKDEDIAERKKARYIQAEEHNMSFLLYSNSSGDLLKKDQRSRRRQPRP